MNQVTGNNNKLKYQFTLSHLFLGLGLLALLWWLFMYQETPKVNGIGYGSQHFIWVEYAMFNNKPQPFKDGETLLYDDGSWGVSGGSISGGYGSPPMRGGVIMVNPKSMPTQVHLRWFDFSKQRFYEARLYVPDLPAKAREARAKHKRWQRYDYTLMITLGDNGEVNLWLNGSGSGVDDDWTFMEFLVSGQAKYAEGDPNRYKNRTAEAREKGEIPLTPNPSEPVTTEKAKEK